MNHLKGLRVVSFNHFFMGPVGIQFLADIGAEVIAIEPIEGAFQRNWGGANKTVDGQTMLLLSGNRNKKSLALDLKDPNGLAIARELIKTADVVAENFRPGVLDKLGLGYDAVREIKPDIIYASASGYGSDGPYVNRPGQDLLIQALSGLATITGTNDGPRAVGVSAVDHHGAALFAAGILAALLRRERTGEGGLVEVSLLSAAIDLQLESFTCFLNGETPDDVRQPKPLSGWYFGAPYGIYQTKDSHVAISLGKLSILYDSLDVAYDDRISDDDAYTRRDQAARTIANAVIRFTTSECEARFAKHGIWHSRINDYSDVVVDPQVRHNKSFVTIQGATGSDITLVRHPITYDGAVPEITLAPQPLGAQTEQIMTELGYDKQRIHELLSKGVIRASVEFLQE
ncbi:L-carnitine dehydratase/bile acid-inducible protein F [Caballeronia catudaia]|uniref:L-carnitine dehydratase/bile acid-inducible protein F n=1 Tax=Caballeronia catudaia TaxID=1777136 RepID=A0A158C6C1_9BURK|nr:CaiB/BaiF CoA-transferase family protein [Caballeronia catudaia]SAK77869.1 L-carnitine dehydratase/bile acid-inducible protein F [Caballeronia catudaia]